MIIEHVGRYDLVCADLTCRLCGQRDVDPCAIDMQTKLAAEPERRRIRVGDEVELASDLEAAGFLKLHEREQPLGGHGTARIVEQWSCTSCGQAFVWARLEFDRGVLARALAVDLVETELEAADYITDQALHLAPLSPPNALLDLAALPAPALRRELARLEAERLAELD